MRPPARIFAAAVCAASLVGSVGCAGTVQPTSALTEPRADLTIGLTEWSIETGPVQAAAGPVTVTVTNTGATRHDLVIKGEQGRWATPVLAPGAQYDLSISTRAGETLHLLCSVIGHHDQGMHSTLPVGPSASG